MAVMESVLAGKQKHEEAEGLAAAGKGALGAAPIFNIPAFDPENAAAAGLRERAERERLLKAAKLRLELENARRAAAVSESQMRLNEARTRQILGGGSLDYDDAAIEEFLRK
jgi:hypothetical protein